jgi:hypothetical protein
MMGLLRSNLTSVLNGKYHAALETEQRVNPSIVEKDTIQIHQLQNLMQAVYDIFETIVIEMKRADDLLDYMSLELYDRIKFHLDRGLEEVQYIA